MTSEYENMESKEDSTSQQHSQSTVTLDVVGESDDNYNPFEHRHVAHPTSTVGSFFNLLKSSLGSGLLAMPAAFKHIGLISGCIGTVVVSIIATHCVHILVSTSQEICKECHIASLSYADTCEKTFKHGPKRVRPYSKCVRHFADYAMAGVCLGGTSVYVIFIASALKDICESFVPDLEYSEQMYCWTLLLPLILFTQMRYLKFLVPFSVLANACLVFTFGITTYYLIGMPDDKEAKLAVSFSKWPLFLSTAIFAMEGINVVMPVENEMAKPEHFLGCPGVLNVTMAFVAVLYGVVGFFGYLKFGDSVLGSVTLNLPQGEMLGLTAKILVAVAVFFTYGLQMYAPLEIIWTRLQHRFGEKYKNIGQITLRVLSVALTVVLAAAFPDLELLIGLVGAVFFSTLGLLIPLTVQTVHRWERDLGKYNYIVWKNSLLLIFYLVVLISGCYSAGNDIVMKYS